MQQTFSLEKAARVHLAKVRGDLEVQGWDNQEISIKWDNQSGTVNQEGNALILINCAGDIEMHVPYDTEVRAEGLSGDVVAQNIRRIELKDVRGSVELSDIGIDADLEYVGEAVSLTDIGGDVTVQQVASLRARRKLSGDVRLQDIRLVEIDGVRSDLDLRQVNMASIGSVGADLEVVGVGEALRCGNVGGDCQISDCADAEVNLGNVGGELEIDGAARLHVGNTGGDVQVRDIQGNVQIGNIGGDGTLHTVGGNLTVGQIGGDAELLGLSGSTRVGGIGGDLELQAAFPPESQTHLNVGGDAELSLPNPANLALQATVGGTINGPSLTFDRHGNLVRLVYGEGTAQVNLSIGGDLHMRGGGTPRVNSASMPWGEFNQEMAQLGQSMAQLGQDLGREFSDMFGEMGRASFAWTDDVGRKVEEQMRRARQKAEQHARRAEERVRDAEARAHRHAQSREKRRSDRMYVRINEREWQMNPERLNDLVNRAQEAAMEGVAGAMEAVEKAVSNLRIQRSPQPPTPPMPPMSKTEQKPAEAVDPETEEPNLEAEREAILRMIAEGRITPEEGDMLLEGLGK